MSIAFELAWLARDATKVGENGRLVEVDDLLGGARRMREERVAARGIDHVRRFEAVLLAPGIGREHTHHPFAFTRRAGHRPLLPDVHAAPRGMIEQHLVEDRALHLVGVVAVVLPCAVEGEAVLAAHCVVMKARAVLGDEGGMHLVEHADGVEDVERLRKERLAQMKAREALLLEYEHLRAALRQPRRADRPTRTTPDHDDIESHGAPPALSPRASAADPAGSALRCTRR